MPFKQDNSGSIEFIRLPLDKCVYGVEKGEVGRKYFYLRRFDFSGLRYESLEALTSTTLDALNISSAKNDWIIPIGSSNKLNYGLLQQYKSSEKISKLLSLPVESRPWFSIVKTPNNVAYFAKRRLSVSTTLQSIVLTLSLSNPVSAAVAMGGFARKQYLKYNMSKSRGEQNPSIMPKMFVHKIWQVSLNGNSEEVYTNIAQILNSGDAWKDFS
jgi:hypothetical protein